MFSPTLISASLLALLGSADLASAHMEMQFPPPLRSKYNPAAIKAQDIDYSMTAPLSASGSDFPCKGYNTKYAPGSAMAASVVTWAPGSANNFTITGGAAHNGGSCQASLSYDNGKTFTVIQSIEGACPGDGTSSFNFNVPTDAPAGDALFSWSWFNKVGNREMYQNCAVVTIGGGKKRSEAEEIEKRAAFSTRPAMFVANVGNGCATVETKDLTFPNPGPDVKTNPGTPGPPSPAGCGGAGAAAGGSSSGGSGSGSGSGSTSASGSPATSAAAGGSGSGAATTSVVTSAATAASSSSSLSGGVFVTVGGGSGSGTASTSAAVQPTTLATTTIAAGTGAAGTTSAVQPTGTGSSGSSGSGSGSSSGGSTTGGTAITAGTACPSDEGAWNCVGGTSFQRCASGQWSVVMAMAAGTTCKTGMGSTLVYAGGRRRGVARSRRGAWDA